MDPYLLLGAVKDAGKAVDKVQLAAEEMLVHSGIFGTSGAGKSFLIGRIIEELTLRTSARCIVIDGSGDFGRLPLVNQQAWTEEKLRDWFLEEDTPECFETEWGQHKISVLSNIELENHQEPLHIGWSSVGPRLIETISQMVSRENPLGTFLLDFNASLAKRVPFGTEPPGTFASLLDSAYDIRSYVARGVTRLDASYYDVLDSAGVRGRTGALAQYIAQLESLNRSSIWAKDNSNDPITTQISDTKVQVLVVDIQSFSAHNAQLLLTMHVVEKLWEHCRDAFHDQIARGPNAKDTRPPHFLIIDEAHHLAPKWTEDRVLESVCEMLREVAAEGRKYGLFLLLATQRPMKLHQDVLSELGGAFLLRMRSQCDINLVSKLVYLDQDEQQLIRSLDAGECLIRGLEGAVAGKFHVSPMRTVASGVNISDHWLSGS